MARRALRAIAAGGILGAFVGTAIGPTIELLR
jgi:hypothetical protein